MRDVMLKDKKHFALLGALGLMFISAYFGFLGTNAVAQITAQVGLSQYEGQLQKLQWYAGAWWGLAITSPFFAALVLGLGKQTAQSQARSYAVRFLQSVIGSVGFMVAIAVVSFLLSGPHSFIP